MKTKLIGSAPSLEQLKQLIIDRWYWSHVDINIDNGTVSSGGSIVDGLRVIKKGSRYRLEMTN